MTICKYGRLHRKLNIGKTLEEKTIDFFLIFVHKIRETTLSITKDPNGIHPLADRSV